MATKEKLKIIIYCFFVSLAILLLTSKCSFFYPFNDWVDANAFFTMGKSLVHGLVPFRDLFEQKGPLLYVIYALGYLMSNTTFHGIFILEIIFSTFNLYYSYKIINLFLSKKISWIIIPLYMTFLCTSTAFTHGGSAEEFCLLFITYSLYQMLYHFKVKDITNKNFFLIGLCTSCVFLIKYTVIGFFAGIMLSIFLDLLFSKKYRQAFKCCLYYFLGFIIPIIITIIYFGINHALKDFINVYFIINLTAYSRETLTGSFKLLEIYRGFIDHTFLSGIMDFILIILGFIFVPFLKLNKKGKISLVFTYFISIFTIYFGLRFYKYYLFPLLIFGLISIILIFSFLNYLKNHFSISLSNKVKNIFLIASLIISLICSYSFANYKEMRFTNKNKLFQYQFASIINEEKNPTLIEMGFVDAGVYTTTNIVPHTYYFEKLNLNHEIFPDNVNAFKKYIENKESTFIVYYTKWYQARLEENEPQLFINYELLKKKKLYYDGKKYYAYLFKIKS